MRDQYILRLVVQVSLVNKSTKALLIVFVIALIAVTASCGRQKGDNVGFVQWYLREYKKGAKEYDKRQAATEALHDRLRRFRSWQESPEGRRAIAARTEQVLVSPHGYPDTDYAMSRDTEFKISSRAAGATLTGNIDYRDRVATATLRRADGRERTFQQGASAEMLGYRGKGPFDDDDRLVAALLRSNPRPGWPGRSLLKTHSEQQRITEEMWQEMTGEKVWAWDARW